MTLMPVHRLRRREQSSLIQWKAWELMRIQVPPMRTTSRRPMHGTHDTTLSGVDRDRLHQAAELLLEARRTVQPIDDLAPGMAPRTLEEAYYVQDLMLKAIGKAGGWKVGAMSTDGTPFYAPMPLDGFTTSGERIAREYRR